MRTQGKDTSAKLRKKTSGWPVARLADICDEMYRYPSFYGMDHLEDGVPVIRGEHIGPWGEISTDWTNYWFISQEVSARFPRTILREGDVIFSVRGTIGKVGIVRNSHDGCQISPNLIRIAPCSGVDSAYLWYYLSSLRESPRSVRQNSVTVSTVKASDLANLLIPLPSMTEQARIANVLNQYMAAVEKARAAAEARLDAAKALPGAFLRRAFENTETENWPSAPLGEVCELLPAKSIASSGDAEVLAITTACLSEVGFNPDGVKQSRMRAKDAEICRVTAGEVLIARSNTEELVGRVSMFEGKPEGVVASDLTIRIKTSPLLDPFFLTTYLGFLHLSGYWRRFAGGASSSMKKITRTQIKALKVPLPDVKVQQAIAADVNQSISSAKEVLDRIEEELSAINALPSAVLRKAFNGEL